MTVSKTGMWADEPPAVLLPLLILLSFLYGALAWVHRHLYSSGLLRRKRLPRPVISVGNLTIGGGGKTPLVIWLAAALAAKGLKPAILSRGYGRKGTQAALVDPQKPWQIAGDEPFLMATRLGHVPVAVAADRFNAGLLVLSNHEVDLFILDDGFQHRRLGRDLDIVVVDNIRRFGNGRLLPAGTLREPLRRLGDADVVVVTRAEDQDEDLGKVISRFTPARIVWSDYGSTELLPLDEYVDGNDNLARSGPFLAFCGIAGPEGFQRSLEKYGLDVVGLETFPDHHPYRNADLDHVVEKAKRLGAVALVTTEKDAVRLPAGIYPLPIFALAVKVETHRGDEALLEPVLDLVRSFPGNMLV